MQPRTIAVNLIKKKRNLESCRIQRTRVLKVKHATSYEDASVNTFFLPTSNTNAENCWCLTVFGHSLIHTSFTPCVRNGPTPLQFSFFTLFTAIGDIACKRCLTPEHRAMRFVFSLALGGSGWCQTGSGFYFCSFGAFSLTTHAVCTSPHSVSSRKQNQLLTAGHLKLKKREKSSVAMCAIFFHFIQRSFSFSRQC